MKMYLDEHGDIFESNRGINGHYIEFDFPDTLESWVHWAIRISPSLKFADMFTRVGRSGIPQDVFDGKAHLIWLPEGIVPERIPEIIKETSSLWWQIVYGIRTDDALDELWERFVEAPIYWDASDYMQYADREEWLNGENAAEVAERIAEESKSTPQVVREEDVYDWIIAAREEYANEEIYDDLETICSRYDNFVDMYVYADEGTFDLKISFDFAEIPLSVEFYKELSKVASSIDELLELLREKGK